MMKINLIVVAFLLLGNIALSQEQRPRFKITVSNIEDQGKYKNLVTDAVAILNELLNSNEFRQRVQQRQYDWVDLGGGEYNNLNGKEVFKILYEADPNPSVNLNIKKRGIRLGAYASGTLGITTIGSNSTRTYNYWLDISKEKYEETVVHYASHIAHEYCHQKGFYDKNKEQPKFRDVVPYAIGDIVCDILNEKKGTNFNCKSE